MHEHANGRDHAVVIGGGIAGLVCARVLSDHFARVTVVEREAPLPFGSARKCVPQGHHVHAMLEIMVRTLRELFPGLIEQLVADGAQLIDFCADFVIHQYGGWKPRHRSDVETLLCTRPFLDASVRRRVQALAQVELLDAHTVEALVWDQAGARVCGVQILGPEGPRSLDAGLVVEVGGRGTRAPRWLEQAGFGSPPQETIEIDLAYTSQLFELPADQDPAFSWLTVASRQPGRRGGFVSRVQGGRWLASLFGYHGDHTPRDDAGFLAFAASLPRPELHQVIADATPVSPIAQFKFPSSRWFHYEQLPRFPDGLLVLGDAICSLNPIYGQGMTVAVQCAVELGAQLAARGRDDLQLRGFSQATQRKLAKLVMVPWKLSTTLDLRFPETVGERHVGLGVVQQLFLDMFDMTSSNPRAWQIFAEVLHMRRGPASLAHPQLLGPLAIYAAKRPFIALERRVNNGPMPARP